MGKKGGFFFKDENGRVIFAGGPTSGGGSSESSVQETEEIGVLKKHVPAENLSILNIGNSIVDTTRDGAPLGTALYNPKTGTLLLGAMYDIHADLHSKYAPKENYDDFVKVRLHPGALTPITIYADRVSAIDKADAFNKAYKTMDILNLAGFPGTTKTVIQYSGLGNNLYTSLKKLKTSLKGFFFRNAEGKVVFAGGPSSGGGGTTGSTTQSVEQMLLENALTPSETQDYKKGAYPSIKVNVEDNGDAIVKVGKDRLGLNDPNTAVAEVAAYEVAKELGYEGIVPPTVMREGASVQAWVDNAFTISQYSELFENQFGPVSEASLKQVLILDALILNSDRHTENLLVSMSTGQSRAVAIDHGLAFGAGSGNAAMDVSYLMQYSNWQYAEAKIAIPKFAESDVAPVRQLLTNDQFWSDMRIRLGDVPTSQMRERAEYLVTPEFWGHEW